MLSDRLRRIRSSNIFSMLKSILQKSELKNFVIVFVMSGAIKYLDQRYSVRL